MEATHSLAYVGLKYLERFCVMEDDEGDLAFDLHVPSGDSFSFFMSPEEATQVWKAVFEISQDVRIRRYGNDPRD